MEPTPPPPTSPPTPGLWDYAWSDPARTLGALEAIAAEWLLCVVLIFAGAVPTWLLMRERVKWLEALVLRLLDRQPPP